MDFLTKEITENLDMIMQNQERTSLQCFRARWKNPALLQQRKTILTHELWKIIRVSLATEQILAGWRSVRIFFITELAKDYNRT